MKQQTIYADSAHGIRFTLLLIPLFAAIVLAVSGLVYPMQIDRALASSADAAPLANPELVLSSEHGEALYLDAQTLSHLSDIGTAVTAASFDTVTADGIRIRLVSVEGTNAAEAFVLTDGRMPQNETECVIVPLDQTALISSAASVTGKEIGSAIRPCGKNGTALTDSHSGVPCALTVVGIGKNILSDLAPITNDTAQLLVYTVSDQCWSNPDTESLLYLTDCSSDDPLSAVQTVYTVTADVRSTYRMTLAEERLQACISSAEKADNAVIAHEITVQEIENRLSTANLRVAEAETNMMNAIADLQAEKQQFVSDMEYNEYYALRQVDLIPRRDRAEEGYAKQEAVIDQMNTALHTAYDDRDSIRVELQHASELLAVLQTEADAAHAALRAEQEYSTQSAVPQVWMITVDEHHPAYEKLQTHAAAVSKSALLLCAVFLGIYLVGSIIVYAVSRTTPSVSRTLLSTALAAVPAVLIGGCLTARPIFAYAYPMLRGVLDITVFTDDTILAGIAVFITAILISTVIACIGRRIKRPADASVQTEHSKAVTK